MNCFWLLIFFFFFFVCFALKMASSSFSGPWPDPNSPILAKIDFGVPVVELFK